MRRSMKKTEYLNDLTRNELFEQFKELGELLRETK